MESASIVGKTSVPAEPAAFAQENIARLRKLGAEERGEMIRLACRGAAEIERGRMESGLPVSQPVPWPPSTIELLSKYARHGRS